MTTNTVDVIVRTVDGCAVLDIAAQNFTYPQTSVIKKIVTLQLEAGQRLFVLNCSQINWVDSYGLATIVATLKLIREQHGQLALYGLNDLFAKLVKITHLDRVLEVWPTEAQAVYYLSTL